MSQKVAASFFLQHRRPGLPQNAIDGFAGNLQSIQHRHGTFQDHNLRLEIFNHLHRLTPVHSLAANLPT